MNNNEKEGRRWCLQRELDLFYIPTRYPNGIPEGMPFEYFHGRHAESAKRACDAVRELAGESFRRLEQGYEST